ncbi:MAG: MOSC domain-containing protein [Deltaproteobacteria bacterium]|nr:MOSC domain-containing protein [Deltaproteobacteria bacterium]
MSRIFQLAVSKGGVPKLPVREAHASELGLDGDGHAHPKIHGGPERALCLYSLEVIARLQAEGHPIWPGSVGENVTIAGYDWASLAAGARLALGPEVIVELTKIAAPCKQIVESFSDRSSKRLAAPELGRWYARVVRPGTLRVGMPVSAL